MSVAILSLEETGKYYMLTRADEDEVKLETRLHIRKQLRASWFMAEAAILAFFDVLKQHGYEHKPLSQMTPKQLRWLGTEEGIRYQQQLRNNDYWPDGILDQVVTKLKADGVYDDYDAVMSGQVNKLKQAGFYVDSDGELSLDTASLKMLAEKWLHRAEVMAERAVHDAYGTQPDQYFATALRDDLIDC